MKGASIAKGLLIWKACLVPRSNCAIFEQNWQAWIEDIDAGPDRFHLGHLARVQCKAFFEHKKALQGQSSERAAILSCNCGLPL